MQICSKPSFAKSYMQRSSKFTSWVLTCALVSVFLASAELSYAQTDSEYYTIDEAPSSFTTTSSSMDSPATADISPLDISPLKTISISSTINTLRRLALSLLRWTLHAESPSLPREKYNRLFHFGRWINDPTDKTCFNTRAKVLIRDSEVPVSFKDKNHCLVETGDWADPYVGQEITYSREIQIDHMVPLKNAYMSGAWEWNFQTRCMYANFMGNKFHLISASGIENMRKGDRGPERYMPPNLGYRCEYLENWLKIKLIWKLQMTTAEVQAIREGIDMLGCDPKKFSLSQRELRRQRKLLNEQNDVCPVR